MSEKANFELGDVVRLNNGSPKLIITELDDLSQRAWVSWIYAGKVESARFPLACLRREKGEKAHG